MSLTACVWDQDSERFAAAVAAYYRGAMGILLVYDVTDEASFNNIRNWMRNIEQHASDTVNKVTLFFATCCASRSASWCRTSLQLSCMLPSASEMFVAVAVTTNQLPASFCRLGL